MATELDSKRPAPSTMRTALAPAHYLGAMSKDQERLTLHAIDPDDPWATIRAMRKQMRRSKKPVNIALFDSPLPVEHSAEIVVFKPRKAV